MDTAVIIGGFATLLGGGGIAAVLLHLRERRKVDAEADLITEDRRGKSWTRFQGEINRLSDRVKAQDERNEELDKRLDECERSKSALRLQVENLDLEIRFLRHRANNSDQGMDALIMIIESNPERLPEAVQLVKRMRENQRAYEAMERAGVAVSRVARAQAEDDAVDVTPAADEGEG